MDDERARREQEKKQRLIAAFGRGAATYDHVGPRIFTYFGERLVDVAQIRPGARVLDAACGRGAVLFPALAATGPTGYVLGIDLADGMVQQTAAELQRLDIQNAEIRQMDAEDLQLAEASFDVVLCGLALFFGRAERMLEEFARVLKPGGRVAVSTWQRSDPRWSWEEELLEAHLRQDQPAAAAKPAEAAAHQDAGQAAPAVVSTWQRSDPKLNTAEGMRTVMAGVGFEQVEVSVVERDFVYADEEEWWATQWSHGGRYWLERLSASALARYKAAAFERMQRTRQPDGFHEMFSALLTVGVKPQL